MPLHVFSRKRGREEEYNEKVRGREGSRKDFSEVEREREKLMAVTGKREIE